MQIAIPVLHVSWVMDVSIQIPSPESRVNGVEYCSCRQLQFFLPVKYRNVKLYTSSRELSSSRLPNN